MISYQRATLADIEGILSLQSLYHIDTVSDTDKKDGFVTTLFTHQQLTQLIEHPDNAIIVAKYRDGIIGYAMNADWAYWSQWAFFQQMIADLPNVQLAGRQATFENSFQYGPICIHQDYRGSDVLGKLFTHSCQAMANRFSLLLTFINQQNPRSYHAHVDKLGLTVIKEFAYQNKHYYYLGYQLKVDEG